MTKTALDTGKKMKRGKSKEKKQLDALPPIQVLEREVLKTIIGQDEHVRKILTAFYRSRIFKNDRGGTLIIGKSGTGKTEIMRQIMKNINIPYVIEDATKYTKEGYVGNDVENMIYNLISKTHNDLALAQKGVIIIDEIDKKATSAESENRNDVSGVEVIKSLLKLMEGTEILVSVNEDAEGLPIEEAFDTTGITFIFMGAFTGIESIVKTRQKNAMGFAISKNKNLDNSSVIKEDLVKYGLIDEFVGRISTVVQLNNLTEEGLVKILKSSTLSPIRRYALELGRMGIKLSIEKELYNEIAKRAMSLSTGARELATVVDGMMSDILYKIFAHPRKYSQCILRKGVLEDSTKCAVY